MKLCLFCKRFLLTQSKPGIIIKCELEVIPMSLFTDAKDCRLQFLRAAYCTRYEPVSMTEEITL